jgi:hypothetical protein
MNSTAFFGLFAAVGGVLISWWAFAKNLFLATYRVEPDAAEKIRNKILEESRWKFVLGDHYVAPPKKPDVFESFVLLHGILFYFSLTERMLTAGYTGKEPVATVTFFRFQRKKIDALLSESTSDGLLPVRVMTSFGRDRLGSLAPDPKVVTYASPGTYEDIEEEVAQVASGTRNKTGFLLHGAPGNGKTQFVKYLAKKYAMPVFLGYFNDDETNTDIALLFANVPPRSIILLEDFDSLFDGRKCLMKNGDVKFTFDAFINALDGVHNDYKQIVFVFTANDLSKVDASLKTRRSRLKFVREFGPPTREVRLRILGDEALADATEGLTLDQVFNHESSPHR